ncbi:hypothetical protein BDW62DRAFT_197360 [Aspergillus aurantiobrunneus]
MAEASSLTANIRAILQIATEVCRLGYSNAGRVRNALKAVKQFLEEIAALIEVSFRHERAIQDAESKLLDDDTVVNCHKDLSNVHFELQKRKWAFLQPIHELEWKA